MTSRKSIPWIHQWSRHLIGAIALVGCIETAWLTAAELSGTAADVCPTSGCKAVLESDYATVFGLPLTFYGLLAYIAMAFLAFLPWLLRQKTDKSFQSKVQETTWLLMFGLGVAMLVFSSYLMYVMLFKIQALCPYCIASAIFSVTLFTLTIIGRNWLDPGQLLMTGCVVGMVTLVGVTGIYANVTPTADSSTDSSSQAVNIPGESGPPITNKSGNAEMALARHLAEVGAKNYGAYWCPHCHEQKELFGQQAFALIDYVECDPKGKNARPQMCKEAGVAGYPTWQINGQVYPGVQRLETLADVSNYQGDREFIYPFPYQ
jgi:uncharacterized membrane protein/glutaredoxin